MIPAVTQRPRARLDILEQFVHFGEQQNIELADRYLKAIGATCRMLALHPYSGIAWDSGIARLQGLRRFRVKGFESYLVFYLPQDNGIEVVRILHGARDVDLVFAQEEG